MNKLTVTLKQHTPLLHFQPMQEGACLRASEVKPKLDKFILQSLGENGEAIAKQNGWLIKDTTALNYKMSILSDEKSVSRYLVASYLSFKKIEDLKRNGIKVLANTPYFAQEKQNGIICRDPKRINEVEKWGMLFSTPIYIRILSKDINLIDTLANTVQLFFLLHNFGTRSNKGFGSFTATNIKIEKDEKDETIIAINDETRLLRENCQFVCRKIEKPNSLEEIFSKINYDYKYLKSGHNKPYKKSILMEYFWEKGIRWEKRFIKRTVEDNEVGFTEEYLWKFKDAHLDDVHYQDNEQYRYARAVLGLAEQFEFLPDFEDDPKLVINITAKDKNIQRYASPLTFKVIDNNIFILIKDSHSPILNQSFNFDIKFRDNKTQKIVDAEYDNPPIDDIKTVNQFDIVDFMKFACDNYPIFGYKPMI